MPSSDLMPTDVAEPQMILADPPIIEAVIEIRAPGTAQPDKSDLRDRVAQRLADYPALKTKHALHLEANIQGNQHSTHSREEWVGVQATSGDGRSIGQFHRAGFIFSRLAPYNGWPEFEREALRLWEIHSGIWQPLDIQRMGVRFINRIGLADEGQQLERILRRAPQAPTELQLLLDGFVYQESFRVAGAPFQVSRTCTLQPPTPPETSDFGLIIDIDASTATAMELADCDVISVLRRLRELKNKTFVGTLTDEFLDRLGRVLE